ncbi:restriction endonuclease [Streptomyces montanus]|uniref:nSTAND3 domain-containing NTPase n=1 Tax=Streptomyces montanus TaxID=2580423 RepID=UPI001FEB762C|nr:restriction endonuclease [Streptomyces montanus]
MDSFELGRLTDHDFEVVCRDLFSDVLGIPLEIFPRGRDRGIDLRHTGPAGTTVVQCKHWPRATQKKLIGRLIKDELPKVRALAPDRYIVATTVGLTVGGKDELRSAFAPYVRSTGDLYGVDEIVAELLRRPDLVRRHFRLWLSSTAVLQTVLNQDQYLRSSWLQKRLPSVADTFVPHEGFERAKQLLETQRVCVIAGIPGVGKTTVALMLAAWLMGNGYEVHEISQDVEEIGTLWRGDTREVFLYDDFLGSTSLGAPLNKNEDNRLLSVMREIQETPGKALVMTTRDYLLEHARLRHDRLAGPDVSDAVSVIRLNDLDLRVRGQILYNHVHRSSLAPDDKRRFADRDVWRPVVRHKNFNPRLVEETLRLSTRRGQDVTAAMLENLDDPRRVWEHIVENELTDEAVHMLEVLFTFRSAGLDDLEESWHRYRKEMGRVADGRTFRRALQVLDGTMVSIEEGRVAFHNPSIEDYVRFHLNADRAQYSELLKALVHEEQVQRLVAAARMADGLGVLARLREHESTVSTIVQAVGDDVETRLWREDESRSTRLEWVLETAELLDSATLAAYVMRETLSPFAPYGPFSHLEGLINSLDTSPLVPQEHAQRFRERVTDAIHAEMLEYVEAGDWYWSIALYHQLRRTPSRASREQATEGLVRNALEELRRLSAEPEREPHIEYLELLEELVDFILKQGVKDELPEEFAVVYGRAERVFAARETKRNEWIQKYRIQLDPSERSDVARDHALVTELMRQLDNIR